MKLLPSSLTALALMALCVGLYLPPRTAAADGSAKPTKQPAAGEEKPKNALVVDVILEDMDLVANTLTARAVAQVIPPRGSVGGVVYYSPRHNPPGTKVTRYEHLPVMPEAGIGGKKLKAGMRATLRLGVIRDGTVAVVGVEEFGGLERVGVDFLDAPAPVQRNK